MGIIEIVLELNRALELRRLLGVTRVGFDLYLWYHIKNNGPGTWPKKNHKKKIVFSKPYIEIKIPNFIIVFLTMKSKN